MRLAFVVASLIAIACKTEGTQVDETTPDGGVTIAPDGKVITPDDGSVLGDPDAPVMLTECQEATMHSDLTWIQEHIFTPSCATSTCHAGASPDVGLSLEAGRAYNNLVNKGSSTFSGWVRVVPGDIEASYLVVALGRADGPPPRDGFMPIGGAEPLCVEKLEAIERWIAAGAPNN